MMSDIVAENDDNRFNMFELSLSIVALIDYIKKESKFSRCFKDIDVLSNKVREQCQNEKYRVEHIKQQLSKLEHENTLLRKRLEQSNIENNRLQKERDKFKNVSQEYCYNRKHPISNNELSKSDEMLSELRLQIRADAKRLKDFEKESNEIIFSLEKKLKHTEKNLFQRGRTIQELTEKLNGTKSTGNIYTVQRHKVNKEMCRLNEVLQHTLTKLHDTEIELEETKTRLSKAMGVRLTDNNPNIADLSDRNRPTKLAERFTELYDNQWTDAFECIYKYCHSETKTIDILLYILQDSMTFCQFKEQEQMQQLQCALELSYKQVHRKCSNDSPKSLKDCRKALSSYAMRNLYEMYISHIKDSEDRVLNKALDIGLFTKECIELCWLMAIQDPPIVFADELRRGCNFDTNLLKPYTTSGTFVDYIVWPALLLYKNGPVLVKGVAQGYGKKSDNQQLQFDKSKDGNSFRLNKTERNNDPRKINIDRNSQKDESGGFYFTNIPGQSHFNTAKFRKASHIPIGFDLVNTDFSQTNNGT